MRRHLIVDYNQITDMFVAHDARRFQRRGSPAAANHIGVHASFSNIAIFC